MNARTCDIEGSRAELDNTHVQPVLIGPYTINYSPGPRRTPEDRGMTDALILHREGMPNPLMALRVPTPTTRVSRLRCALRHDPACYASEPAADVVPHLREVAAIVLEAITKRGQGANDGEAENRSVSPFTQGIRPPILENREIVEIAPPTIIQRLTNYALAHNGEVSVGEEFRQEDRDGRTPLGIQELEPFHVPTARDPRLSLFCIDEQATHGSELRWREFSEELDDAGQSRIIAAGVSGSPKDQKEALDRFCTTHFGGNFAKYAEACPDGRLHWRVQNNGTVTVPMVVFEPDATNLYRVRKHFISAVVSAKGVMFFTPSDSHFVHNTLEALHRSGDSTIGSTSKLLFHMLEESLRFSEETIRALDRQVEQYKHGTVTQAILDNQMDQLKESFGYLARKLEEMADVTAVALRRASEVKDSMITRDEAISRIEELSITIRRLTGQARENVSQINELASAFDRALKMRSDKSLELFTIIIGYSAPPIIADLACKFFLHHESPAVMAGAFGVAIMAHLYTHIHFWGKRHGGK